MNQSNILHKGKRLINYGIQQIGKAWKKIKNNIANNNVKKEIIWNNTKTKCNGETFF